MRLVAVCNSLPMNMFKEGSDIDLCVITQKNRIFTARLGLTILTSIFALRRHGTKIANRFCLSFFADEENLRFSSWALQPQDIYLAFWIQSLDPISGQREVFKKIVEENSEFLSDYFARPMNWDYFESTPSKIQKILEFLLAPSFIENTLKKWQMHRAEVKKSKLPPDNGVRIEPGLLKFHDHDARPFLQKLWYHRVMKHEAIFAAGCFWGVEESFRTLPGVLETEVGYIGGNTENPTYEDVCTKNTRHAEAVRVVFEPEQISYEDLLRHFFKIHNPTTFNRQGPDVGSQYRSAIFVNSSEQEELAQKIITELDSTGAFLKPIVTSIEPASTFYPAEDYHQKYILKGGAAACHI